MKGQLWTEQVSCTSLLLNRKNVGFWKSLGMNSSSGSLRFVQIEPMGFNEGLELFPVLLGFPLPWLVMVILCKGWKSNQRVQKVCFTKKSSNNVVKKDNPPQKNTTKAANTCYTFYVELNRVPGSIFGVDLSAAGKVWNLDIQSFRKGVWVGSVGFVGVIVMVFSKAWMIQSEILVGFILLTIWIESITCRHSGSLMSWSFTYISDTGLMVRTILHTPGEHFKARRWMMRP